MVEKVKNTLEQSAIDSAFIRHVGQLFDRYCQAIKDEGEHRIVAKSHARSEFQKDYAYAVTTHKEMSDHIAK